MPPSPWKLLSQQGFGGQEPRRLSHGWLPAHSASAALGGLCLAGGRRGSCSARSLFLFSLPPPLPPCHFLSPARAPSFTFLASSFFSFSHRPQFPPPFILPLKRISCFLILSSPSELRTTLGSLPSPLPFLPGVLPPPLLLHLPQPLGLLVTSRRHFKSPD